MVLEYERFHGNVYYPDIEDLKQAEELQRRLAKIGRMKTASDLIIAATCINNNEQLLTKDSDFDDIARVSDLRI